MGDVYADPLRIRQSGQSACEMAAELADARRQWAAETDEPGHTLGYHEARSSYLRMQDAWFAEFGVYLEVLSELCHRLHAAASAYEAVDAASARAFVPAVRR